MALLTNNQLRLQIHNLQLRDINKNTLNIKRACQVPKEDKPNPNQLL